MLIRLAGQPGTRHPLLAEGPHLGNVLQQHLHRAHDSKSKIGGDQNRGWAELTLPAEAPHQADDLPYFGGAQRKKEARVSRIDELLVGNTSNVSLLHQVPLDVYVVDGTEGY